MKSNTILYRSSDIRKAIIDIFRNSKGRRVVITAFVGSGAEAYLPNPKGIELICWPNPSGTNPKALKVLNKLGVKIFFSDRLHTKLYWTEDLGAVITSANLSTNAFGAGKLKEFGIFIPSEKIDINRVLTGLKKRKITKKELLELEKAHRSYQSTNKIAIKFGDVTSFLDWYQDKYHEKWKLYFWGEELPFSSNAIHIAKQEYGVLHPFTSIMCAKKSYEKGDWVLCVKFIKDMPKKLEWVVIDFVTDVDQSDPIWDPDCPCEAVQLRSMKYNPPPFQIDEKFRKAFFKALKQVNVSKFNNDGSIGPLKKLIEITNKYY
jgi:hypothetical protein